MEHGIKMSEKLLPPDPSRMLSSINLSDRRSSRQFSNSAIDLGGLGSILYAAQGKNTGDGGHLIPSAGRSYPLRVRVAVQRVSSLPPGLYLYEPDRHALAVIKETPSALSEVTSAAFDAPWLSQASAVLLISAEFERTTVPYASQPPEGRAERYVWLEAGHAAQNVALAAAALALGTVFVGGFHDELMSKVFRLSSPERPIGVMPVGHHS